MGSIVSQFRPADVAPLAAYYTSQKQKSTGREGNHANGSEKRIAFDGKEETGVPACVGCHQPQGAGHNRYPRIGAQHPEYVARQLKNFAAGERSNDVRGFMRVTAKRA